MLCLRQSVLLVLRQCLYWDYFVVYWVLSCFHWEGRSGRNAYYIFISLSSLTTIFFLKGFGCLSLKGTAWSSLATTSSISCCQTNYSMGEAVISTCATWSFLMGAPQGFLTAPLSLMFCKEKQTQNWRTFLMGCLLNPLVAACPAPLHLPSSVEQVFKEAHESWLWLILSVVRFGTWESTVL